MHSLILKTILITGLILTAFHEVESRCGGETLIHIDNAQDVALHFNSLKDTDGNKDGNYDDNLDCVWIFVSNSSCTISLSITSIDIESKYDACDEDYLEIFDEPYSDSKRFGRYCGETIGLKWSFQSSKNSMRIRFHSDTSHGGQGFKATIQKIYNSCYPNSTIMMEIVPRLYKSVMALHNNTFCQVSQSSPWIIIDCGTHGDRIEIFASQLYNLNEVRFHTGEVFAATITCEPLLEAMHVLNNSYTAATSMPYHIVASPTYDIKLALRTVINSPVEITRAKVADELYLTIDIPGEYTMVPKTCISFPLTVRGTVDIFENSNQLIKDGCSVIKTAVANFELPFALSAQRKRYTAKFKVLKYFKTNQVLIQCLIRVCGTFKNCTFSCSAERQRRQTYPEEDNVEYSLSTKLIILTLLMLWLI